MCWQAWENLQCHSLSMNSKATTPCKETGGPGAGEIKDRRAVEPLIALLKDKDPLIRRHAVKAVGKIGDVRGGDSSHWRSERQKRAAPCEDDSSRIAGTDRGTTIGRVPHRRIARSSLDRPKRGSKSLGQYTGFRAVSPLVLALQDEDPSVRGHVVDALGEIRDPRAEEPLRSALKDGDKNVRKRAEQALTKIVGNSE